ncbi:MAG: excinuclease ABC subunit UvrC [Legionellaceae bacterium]|nr:excinuclease ABC subunit UvrC [Legionellaceae bacterium]
MSSSSKLSDLEIFLKNLTTEPGVYRMLDEQGQVLYVGKAKNLKKRVGSYFSKQQTSSKQRSLVSQIISIEVHITRSETEALLLESSLIKSIRPKYNVLMRDDKSYPFIQISSASFPNITVKRCKKKPNTQDFFGPYPSVTAVRETMNMIQKIFKIRNCTDSYFNARSRPCLQYQIKRCSAPCTDYISKEEYEVSVNDARRFLSGNGYEILDDLALRMDKAVAELAFEEAAFIRDQIKSLRLIQEQQGIVKTSGDLDVIVIEVEPGIACVQCVCVRNGEVQSCDSFFPEVPDENLESDEQVWQQVFNLFINHYYLTMPGRVPKQILTNRDVEDKLILQEMLNSQGKVRCTIKKVSRGSGKDWIEFALNNLHLSVAKHNTSVNIMRKRYEELEGFLSLEHISKMECFDISHTQGSSTVASCVVFDEHGPCNREYRRFNINDITKGDDYAAMEQAITRRYKQAKNVPDVLVIDGGKGQVSVAKKVLASLNITSVTILGIAKGPSRKATMERLLIAGESQEVVLPSDSKALHLLMHIRDESHRFAISLHRKKRDKSSMGSSIENLEGIGPKRRQALLRRFGGMRELSSASIEELEKVPGISNSLAKLIYNHFK